MPDLEKVLHEKKLKIMVKMKNMKFSSLFDVFEGQGAERFMTEKQILQLKKQKEKESAIKEKSSKHIPTRDIILGY